MLPAVKASLMPMYVTVPYSPVIDGKEITAEFVLIPLVPSVAFMCVVIDWRAYPVPELDTSPDSEPVSVGDVV